ncbi:hypothetical protein IWQ62_000598 [Dispira parvispora]|uniref:RING-type domain-containing protein n=1 Tax=Dispira parvispora TaxID=1520584 RepID=A0A9W8EA02_9FUNG|nr:hypothetical protein IWQ62_000598 [Dispira parvispora]
MEGDQHSKEASNPPVKEGTIVTPDTPSALGLVGHHGKVDTGVTTATPTTIPGKGLRSHTISYFHQPFILPSATAPGAGWGHQETTPLTAGSAGMLAATAAGAHGHVGCVAPSPLSKVAYLYHSNMLESSSASSSLSASDQSMPVEDLVTPNHTVSSAPAIVSDPSCHMSDAWPSGGSSNNRDATGLLGGAQVSNGDVREMQPGAKRLSSLGLSLLEVGHRLGAPMSAPLSESREAQSDSLHSGPLSCRIEGRVGAVGVLPGGDDYFSFPTEPLQNNLSHLNQHYSLKVYLVNGPVQGGYQQVLVDQIALTSWTSDKAHTGNVDEARSLTDKGIQGILSDSHVPVHTGEPSLRLNSQRQGISYFSCHDPMLSTRERELSPDRIMALILYQPVNRPCLPKAEKVVQDLASKVPVFFHTAPRDLFSEIRAYVDQHHVPYTLVVGAIEGPVGQLNEPMPDSTKDHSSSLTPGPVVETSFLVYVACAVLGIMTIGSVGLLVHRYYCQRNRRPQGASGSYTITIADLGNNNHPALGNTGSVKRGIDAEVLKRFPVQKYTPELVGKCRMGSPVDAYSPRQAKCDRDAWPNHSQTPIMQKVTTISRVDCKASQAESLDEEALRNQEFLVGLDLAGELPKVPTLAQRVTTAATLPRLRSSGSGGNLATATSSIHTLTDLFDVTAIPITPPMLPTRPSSGFDRWTSQDLCPICLCEFQVGEHVRVLPCHHPFHCECIDPWLLYVSTVCPMCKSNMSEAIHSSAGGLSEHSMVAPNVGIPRPVRLSSLGISPPNPTTGRVEYQQNRLPLILNWFAETNTTACPDPSLVEP